MDRWRDCGGGEQTYKTQSLPQLCVYVRCDTEPHSDRAQQLMGFQKYARARDAALWRQQLTRSEWIDVSLVKSHKKSPRTPGNTFFNALRTLFFSKFQISRLMLPKNRASRGFWNYTSHSCEKEPSAGSGWPGTTAGRYLAPRIWQRRTLCNVTVKFSISWGEVGGWGRVALRPVVNGT